MQCWELSRKAGFRFSQEQSVRKVSERECAELNSVSAAAEKCQRGSVQSLTVSERECAELNSVDIFRESKRVTEVSDGGEESLAEVPNI